LVCVLHSDLLTRYLNKSQRVPVYGLGHFPGILFAVTMGNKINVKDIEMLYAYDVDYTKVHHPGRCRRCIVCSKPRQLVIIGLLGEIKRILPCPSTNSLYLLVDPKDWNNRPVVRLNGSIYRITPEGIVLSVWNLHKPVYFVRNLAIGPTGRCLAVVASKDIFYFSSTGTSAGHCNIS